MRKQKRFTLLIACLLLTSVLLSACGVVKNVNGTLTFMVEGEVYDTVSIDVSTASVTMPDDPVKEGYIFGGWYYDENIWKKPLSISSLLDSSLSNKIELTVYARFMTEDEANADYANAAVVDAGEAGDHITWTFYDNNIFVLSGYGEMTEFARIDNSGYMPNYIPWNVYATRIEQVVIENGITSIAGCTFYDCVQIENISLPDSVTYIGGNAFSGCRALTSITIPSGVSNIDDYAFNNCSSLTDITIPDSVICIGDRAFNTCSLSLDIHYGGTFDEWNAISRDENGEDEFASSVTVHCTDRDIYNNPNEGYEVDKYCPDFTLELFGSGEKFTLSENNDKITIINFWASWCYPCIAELPDFDQFAEQFAEQVNVLGVNIDGHVGDKATLYPNILFASGTDLYTKAECGGIVPATLMVDQEGKIIYRKIGKIGFDELLEAVSSALEIE